MSFNFSEIYKFDTWYKVTLLLAIICFAFIPITNNKYLIVPAILFIISTFSGFMDRSIMHPVIMMDPTEDEEKRQNILIKKYHNKRLINTIISITLVLISLISLLICFLFPDKVGNLITF